VRVEKGGGKGKKRPTSNQHPMFPSRALLVGAFAAPIGCWVLDVGASPARLRNEVNAVKDSMSKVAPFGACLMNKLIASLIVATLGAASAFAEDQIQVQLQFPKL
jgi:hypothetical protein